MNLPDDFLDLLREFARASVRYLVVGGYAVSFHDRPRYTKDLDVLLDPSPDNVSRAASALRAFGAPPSTVRQLENSRPDEVVWLGTPPLRIDLFKELPGVEFSAAYDRRTEAIWRGVSASVIAARDLIQAKRATDRDQDRVDAARLEKLLT